MEEGEVLSLSGVSISMILMISQVVLSFSLSLGPAWLSGQLHGGGLILVKGEGARSSDRNVKNLV